MRRPFIGLPSLRRSQLDWVLFHVEPEFWSLHINIKERKTTQLLVALEPAGAEWLWSLGWCSGGGRSRHRGPAFCCDWWYWAYLSRLSVVSMSVDCAVTYRDGGMVRSWRGLCVSEVLGQFGWCHCPGPHRPICYLGMAWRHALRLSPGDRWRRFLLVGR